MEELPNSTPSDSLFEAARRLYQGRRKEFTSKAPLLPKIAHELAAMDTRLQRLISSLSPNRKKNQAPKSELLLLSETLTQRAVDYFEEWEMLASPEETATPDRLLEAFADSHEMLHLSRLWHFKLILLDSKRHLLFQSGNQDSNLKHVNLKTALTLTPNHQGILKLDKLLVPFSFQPLANGLLILLHQTLSTS